MRASLEKTNKIRDAISIAAANCFAGEGAVISVRVAEYAGDDVIQFVGTVVFSSLADVPFRNALDITAEQLEDARLQQQKGANLIVGLSQTGHEA